MLLNSKKTSKICGLFLKNNAGAALVEMALVVPLLFTIVFATIEFGNYYIRAAIVQRNATQVASYIQTALPNSTAADANYINQNALNLVAAGMTLCANTGANQQNPNCGPNASVGRSDAGVSAQSPYVVQIVVWQSYSTLTGISTFANFQFPNQIVARSSIVVPPATPLPPTAACPQGQILTYNNVNNANKFECSPIALPTCPPANISDPVEKSQYSLQYDGTSFSCNKLQVETCPPSYVYDEVEKSKYSIKFNGINFTCNYNASAVFGGMFTLNKQTSYFNGFPVCGGTGAISPTYVNPVTGGYNCPLGFNYTQISLDSRQGRDDSCTYICWK